MNVVALKFETYSNDVSKISAALRETFSIRVKIYTHYVCGKINFSSAHRQQLLLRPLLGEELCDVHPPLQAADRLLSLAQKRGLQHLGEFLGALEQKVALCTGTKEIENVCSPLY